MFSTVDLDTYLLMLASTSASVAYPLESSVVADKFVEMANASLDLSFLAFMAFALATLVSTQIACAVTDGS